MATVYFNCIAFGITILVLTFIFDFLDDIIPDIDLFDFELFDFDIVLLPISMRSICAGLVIFGSLGLLFYKPLGVLISSIIGIACGYLFAVIYSSFVKWLKKHQSLADSLDSYINYDCIVTQSILNGGIGEILVNKPNSASMSIPAISESGVTIEQGTKCFIKDIVDGIACVEITTN
jgi:hypothetical protein